jgi:hypothetical protein
MKQVNKFEGEHASQFVAVDEHPFVDRKEISVS